MTLSFSAAGMFAANPGNQLIYESALKRESVKKRYSKLLPARKGGQAATGKLRTIGKEHGMAEHRQNVNYTRWRYEKDVKPKGYTDLDVSDLPEFTALSPSFKVAQGADVPMSHGVNQYGSSHFKFRPGMLGRAMFQFTAKGPLRQDPLLLLHDVAVDVPQDLVSAKTALDAAIAAHSTASPADKAQRLQDINAARAVFDKAKDKATQATNVLHALMFNLAGDKKAFLDQQQIEVQVFGQVDVATDVETIYLDPAEPAQIKQNAKDFASAHGITVEETKKKEGTETYAAIAPGRDPNAIKTIQDFLRNKPEGAKKAGVDIDKLALAILGTVFVKQGEETKYNTMVQEFVSAYNKLGYFERRSKDRKQLLQRVNNHRIYAI